MLCHLSDGRMRICISGQLSMLTNMSPRYRYTPEGERIDNITDWALKQFRAHYAKAAASPSPLAGEGGAQSARMRGSAARAQCLTQGTNGWRGTPRPVRLVGPLIRAAIVGPLIRSFGPPSPARGEGNRQARANAEFARTMRKEPTDAERTLWHLLRGRRFSGFKFRRQAPIGPYIADFVCFEARLIVEADGSQHAESAVDAERDAWFAKEGFRVRRFWNAEILAQREVIEDTLWHDLADASSGRPAAVASSGPPSSAPSSGRPRPSPHPALRATFSRKGRRARAAGLVKCRKSPRTIFSIMSMACCTTPFIARNMR